MQTQYLERQEGKLAYSDNRSSGQPVVMLPGIGALRSEYRFLAPRLRKAGYRTVTVDLRGQGESSVPWPVYDVPALGADLLAVIDQLKGGAAHVIGTSIGAAAAVWAAAEHPESIRSLVLVNGFVRREKTSPANRLLFRLMLTGPWRLKAWTLYYGALFPARKPPDYQTYISRLTQNLKEKGRFNALTRLAYTSRKPAAERLSQVKAPVLVVMGAKDPSFVRPRAEGSIVAEETGGRLEIVEGAGHYPQTEMAETTSKIVIGFLKETVTLAGRA